ncbi:MAG: autoinducer binding domain-containing protein [Pseudomonadota bacterium]
MQTFLDWSFCFLERAHRCRDFEALWALYLEVIQPLDLIYASYAYLPFPNPKIDLADQQIWKDNFPAVWSERYDDMGFFEHDVSVSHCKSNGEALRWSEIEKWAKQGRLTEAQAKVHQEAVQHGLGLGLTIPLPVGSNTGMAGMSLAFGPNTSERQADSVLQSTQLLLEAVTRYFHASAPTFLNQLYGQKLTDKQKQCLILLAKGYINKEVAYELGISEKTVEIRAREVRQKLKCQTVANCVAKAIALGLIEI